MQTNSSSCQKADLGIQQDPDPASLQQITFFANQNLLCFSMGLFSTNCWKKKVLDHFLGRDKWLHCHLPRAEHWAVETPLWISRHISCTDAVFATVL